MTQAEAFMQMVTVNTNECIVWPYGKVGKMKYGKLRFGRKWVRVHRLAYELMNGNGIIPDGLDVCHTCDNPPCFNPNHLFAGTAHDNRQDQKNKGRTRKGDRHHNTKLTEADVLAIRRLYRKNVRGSGQGTLAKRFGVSNRCIWLILRHKNWDWLGLRKAHRTMVSTPFIRSRFDKMQMRQLDRGKIKRRVSGRRRGRLSWPALQGVGVSLLYRPL